MDRPKILLLGDGPHNRYLAEILAKIDFADVEQRILNDMVITGRSFDSMGIVDEYTVIGNVPAVRVYDYNPYAGADHPVRKREPKGPRGKWGKLK